MILQPHSMMLLWAKILFLFQLQLSKISSSEHRSCILPDSTLASQLQLDSIINDGFCDCADGSDEMETAACSYIHQKSTFTCPNHNAAVKVVIPLSRVQDGLCDCCDGSDENNIYKNNICENTCEKDLISRKQSALNLYQNVRDGMKVKRELLNSFQLKKATESKSYDALKIEKTKIMDYVQTIKNYLLIESKLEDITRFKLLREREDKCARGYKANCDYFFEGFFDDKELLNGFDFRKSVNPRTRIKYSDQEKEKKILNSLEGMAKIKSVICQNENLLPDESTRIFVVLDDYINFVKSQQGSKFFEKTVEQLQKETLFGPYIDHGKEGIILFSVIAAEYFGIVLSLIILLLHRLEYYYTKHFQILFSFVENYRTEMVQKYPRSDAFSYYSIMYIYYKLTDLYDDTQTEGTSSNNVIRFLDPFRYSSVMAFLDYTHVYYTTPIWFLSIASKSPIMYYDYYISNSYSSMPCRRHACLLRSGIEYAEKEILIIENKMKDEEIRREQEKMKNENKLQNTRKEKKKARGKRKDDRKYEINGEDLSSEIVDYGPEDSWEVLKGKCLNGEFGVYKYNFCFFGTFKQGYTVLGKFNNWGTINNLDNSNDEEEDTSSSSWFSTSSKQKEEKVKLNAKTNIKSDINNIQNLESGSSSRYSSQLYDEGTICQVGALIDGQRARRKIQVNFICSAKSSILEITEPEVCVYLATVETPLACSDEMETIRFNSLEALGVLGFSTSSTTL